VSSAGRPPEPPLEALPPDAPATVEDVRATRRWIWVALAWAIAASAIALFALLNQDDQARNQPVAPDNSARLSRLERDTRQRLDAFERRLGNRASQDDVRKLERRLARAEDDAAQAKKDAAAAKDADTKQDQRLDDLEGRVDDLEAADKSQPGGAGDGTTP
jgi:septal ring factor EnvC (AmiA/AmiB activator)